MLGTVKTNLFWILVVLSSHLAIANDVTQAYVEQYKSIAINEMNEYGIPASIKMAQAILESSSGRSSLAKESNNHFGIKCGGDWIGKTAYREDDDYENGLLVKSCFRAYDDPALSFRAHSQFLANPKSKRYKFLFDLDRYDYKSWARGLQKAGYATDPKYPSKLIKLIETYELYLLDFGLVEGDDEPALVDNSSTSGVPYRVDNNPDEPTSPKAETPIIIDVINDEVRRSNKGHHVVSAGESMAAIARAYNMDVKELYVRNRMKNYSQPKQGERLVLDRFIHFKGVPEESNISDIAMEDDFLWEETISVGGR